MTNKNAFGEFLRNYLKENNISTHQLHEKSKVSQPYISQIINGKKPSVKIVKKISDALNIEYQYLLRLAGHLSEEDVTISPNERMMMQFGFFLQFQEKLINLDKKIDEGNATPEDIEDREKLLRRFENQKDKILYYLYEVDLERFFEKVQKVKIGGKVLSDKEKSKALDLLKLTFDN